MLEVDERYQSYKQSATTDMEFRKTRIAHQFRHSRPPFSPSTS